MAKAIAAILCVVCLIAATRDARAQASGDQGGSSSGWGPSLSPYASTLGAYGSQGTNEGESGTNPDAQQPNAQSGIMGVMPKRGLGARAAVPGSAPNPDAIGLPKPRVPVVMCLNRNPPEGMVITKSVRLPTCGSRCESELQRPAGHRMLICRGQAIPKGYTLELLTSTPDCECYGSGQNAYMIKAEGRE